MATSVLLPAPFAAPATARPSRTVGGLLLLALVVAVLGLVLSGGTAAVAFAVSAVAVVSSYVAQMSASWAGALPVD